MSSTSPSVEQSATPMASTYFDGLGSRLFATKKISVLINDNNYLLRHQQVLLAIKTYKLQHFINPGTVPPPQIILDDTRVLQSNLEFNRFEQQDRTLASWLLSSVSPSVLLHLIGLNTSAQIWIALGYCDRLTGCGEVISDQEHVTAILNGLFAEYESVVTIITASQVPYSVQGVTTMLLDAEACQQLITVETPSSKNLVSHTPECQLCGKSGHLVDRCYYRFDTSYKSTNCKPPLSPQANSNPFVAGSMQPVRSPPPVSYHPQALLATPETVADSVWYPDSGATHYLTNSSAALSESSSYAGPGKVYVGNGMALPVKSTGQSYFRTQPRALFMLSLLFVPGITKNLLSVSKFTKDNKVMFEFFPTQCQIRDLQTKEVLLRGSVHDGLYRLTLPRPFKPTVFSASVQCFATTATGPALISSNGFRYYIAFSDACSRYTWVYFLHKKSERVSYPYSSEQNGLVKRKHRQIVEACFSMLAHASMPLSYWNDAFCSAVYLINRLPSSPLGNISPYEKLFHVKPDYSFFRVFDCLCFPNLRSFNTHKLQFRSTQCLFLGYSPLHCGYRCQDRNGKIYISRHVTFHESIFPCQTTPSTAAFSVNSPSFSAKLLVLATRPLPNPISSLNSIPDSSIPTSCSHSLVNPFPAGQSMCRSASPSISNNHSSNSSSSIPLTNTSPPLPPISPLLNSHAMITHSKAGIYKPKAYLIKATSSSSDTPTDIHEAMQNASWSAAVHSDLLALLQNNTWTLCLLPVNRRTIGCKWLFKVKRKADGTGERYKAWMVTKGFSQHAGLNFRDTFSPVVRAATIHIILATAVMRGWSLRQIDVNNALLNGDLTEEIYMAQPLGFEVSGTDGQKLVCRLNKALYSLRQTPRAWFHTLKRFLVTQLGFNASKTDNSLFIRHSSDTILLLMVYIDDIVITGNSNDAINNVVCQLNNKFALKDMGQLTATPTLMVSTPKLTTVDDSPPFPDAYLYHSTVGMLHGTVNHGVYFSKRTAETVCYSDADWASSVEDRHSTTEYRGLANCVSKLLWVKQLLNEIGLTLSHSPVVWCDNTSTVSIAANPTHHDKMKHVEIDHHFIREKVLDGTFQVNYVPSAK
ncbi:hypothetical protein CXB51_008460 [Gossypium anomalum]|uniref:Integrase catalytic domain-containing protein n=1 Tax=Gossypium anomalum TaxID=47600 RepID=A0A8J5ZK54_9ROSI|nr:hypothetical protein CXB51_008460 [Gossypium anomalum]